MQKITITLFLLSLLFTSVSVNAQKNSTPQLRNCATDQYNALLLKNNPKMMGSDTYEKLMAPKIAIEKAKLNANTTQRLLQFTIPVVVHVIHNGEPVGVGANISDAQVISQIQVMNDDFRRMAGTNGFNTNASGADVEVEFCLAKQTPDGCVTNGIDRVDMSAVSTSWSGPGGNTNSVLKPATIWDASQYMNMWSVNFSDGSLLGFAQFPGGPANTDGVVSNYTYFGSNDAAGVNIPGSYNLGRTMTHEVGHYLGLYHTFQGGCGAENANQGDYCGDTPSVAGPNFGCPTGTNSCPELPMPAILDMVENYMDYTDDACMNIFTNDQKARVIAVMNNAANRPNTSTSNVCNELASVANDGSIELNSLLPVSTCSNEIAPNIKVQNWGSVTLTTATITYDIDNGTPYTYNWSGALGYGESDDLNLPTIASTSGAHVFNISISNPNGNSDARVCNNDSSGNFNTPDTFGSTNDIALTIVPDNYGSEITWTFSDGNGVLFSGGPYTDGDTTVINQVFPVTSNNCYAFEISDGFGDGICCSYGAGSYELRTSDNTLIFNGGEFANNEITNISTQTLSVPNIFDDQTISIFPNPTTDRLYIKLGTSNILPDHFEVFNMLGQSIAKKSISGNEDLMFDSSSLSNGMYFIRISKDSSFMTLPFIKK